MSYAIGYIIYGWPINDEIREVMRKLAWKVQVSETEPIQDGWDDSEPEDYGFETKYSGSGESPCWFGIVLSEIDECSNIKLTELPKPHPVHNDKLKELQETLPPELQEVMGLDTADYWILWGSS